MKIHFPNACLDKLDYQANNLIGPTKTKAQAILNTIRGRFSEEKSLRGSLKREKAVQIIFETVEHAAQVNKSSLAVEEFRDLIFTEHNLVFSNC